MHICDGQPRFSFILLFVKHNSSVAYGGRGVQLRFAFVIPRYLSFVVRVLVLHNLSFAICSSPFAIIYYIYAFLICGSTSLFVRILRSPFAVSLVPVRRHLCHTFAVLSSPFLILPLPFLVRKYVLRVSHSQFSVLCSPSFVIYSAFPISCSPSSTPHVSCLQFCLSFSVIFFM